MKQSLVGQRYRCKDVEEIFFVSPEDRAETLEHLPNGVHTGDFVRVTLVRGIGSGLVIEFEHETSKQVFQMHLWAFTAWFESLRAHEAFDVDWACNDCGAQWGAPRSPDADCVDCGSSNTHWNEVLV
jgi:hypothetical protein